MDACLKTKFIPENHEEDLDIDTTLFIFAQIVAENCGTNNLLVYYFQNDEGVCIFDGAKKLLMETLSIELTIELKTENDFYSPKTSSENPHIVFVDRFLDDKDIAGAALTTIPPFTFVISRGNVEGIHDKIYTPIFTAGKGNNKLELVRWSILEFLRKVELLKQTVITVQSEDDLDKVRNFLNETSKYNQLIIQTSNPDKFGLKKIVYEYRTRMDQSSVYVMFSDEEIDDEVAKRKIQLRDSVFSVLKNGIWGGEYYVPVGKS